ncbi:MAG: SDR family NAD(P)-dependent oxidoreductase [Deltaproteobacteria bacterium]|nr:SDR family NAD(P)-dependent oxidoreductase [Deltaproteobacteria bacterium]
MSRESFDPSPKRGARAPVPAGEPIAIVGMACRFPGAPDIASFWRLLEAGEHAITQGVPGSGVGRIGELFPDAAVQSEACRFGAFVTDIDRFDAAFFRISPVEAALLDPQQRMMLETSWQALEDAGVDPERLKGTRTGVYAGISNNEYRGLILGASETAEPATSLYTVTGTSFNTAIGRVAFALGLEGPAMAVDTACSSSLVAMHQAVSGLQRGEADLALAGGVHAILSGRLFELRGNAGMLAPDGRCKTFDAAANGYVRGEGCGIVVLKRLADAEADGDRIWGVIRAVAVNQDGASPGLTVPSGPAQERVIADALARAGVLPSDVDYVEAHGTGTPVGDPIEAGATGAAYGEGRDPDRPLLIGSVKTNVGHLESAAGVAALIKVVLSMQRGTIPRHLNFREPNPEMEWSRLPLRVTAEPTDWPRRPGLPPLAGISGFGWSGTNAHVVVQGYDAPAATGPMRWPAGPSRAIAVRQAEEPAAPAGLEARRTRLLPLSGKTEDALRGLAGRYLDWLDKHAGEPSSGRGARDSLLSDMAWTASVGRSHFGHRKALPFRDAANLREGLRELAGAGGTTAPVADAPARVAFAYTGQASQWVGMGKDLYETEPVARAVLDRCDAVLREERGVSLLDVMFGRTGDLDDPAWTQPAIYALECALTALWSSLGIRPDVVVGHSLGEIAAAQAAGGFGLEEGLRFAAARGALMGALPGEAAMAAIFATEERVAEAVEQLNAAAGGPGVSIAADNGASQVISGYAADVEAVLARFESEDVQVRRLRKSPAYHSAVVEPALDGVEAALSGVAVAAPSVVFVSTVTGRVTEPGKVLDGGYWRRQARERVAFRSAVETLAELGVDAVVEIGPHAVLGPIVSMAWPAAPVPVLSSLRRPPRDTPADEARDSFVAAAAEAYEAGLPVSFAGLFGGEERRRIALPNYPFVRERHWFRAPRRRRQGAGHPLLGNRHESASGEVTYETEVFPSDPSWLDDHRVFGRLVAPGALYGAMAAAASAAEGAGGGVLEDMQLHNPLIFSERDSGEGDEAGRKMQVLLDAAGDTPSRRVRILSRPDDGERWTLHAEARVAPGAGGPNAEARVDLDSLKAGLSPEDVPAFYRAKAEVGIGLGPAFQTLKAVWSRTGEAVGEVALPKALEGSGLDVHPLLLDGCFQVMAAARGPAGGEGGITYLPFGWDRLWLKGRLPERLVCHVRMREAPSGANPDSESGEPREVLSGELRVYEPDGVLVGEFTGYTVKRATRAALLAAVEGLEELLYEIVWRDRPLAPGMPAADFFPSPAAARGKLFSEYMADEGVEAADRAALLDDLERLSRSYALATLDKLGWERKVGAAVDSEELRQRLEVQPEHQRLFRRLLEMLARAGVVEETDGRFTVRVGSGDALPEEMHDDPDAFAVRMLGLYSHGTTEIGLFRRSAGALAEVLRGHADPLTLLFSSGEPTAADLYLKAPAARAANRMLADAVRVLVAGLPEGRRLRVIEVGAGTGSATASVLPELPAGRFDYTYTDISAGFFAEAEARFGDAGGAIQYRVLDIEKEPLPQGFDLHGYDLLIASNVLHATRYLQETLAHCRDLLAPSGQLLALENQRGQGWLDLTFGQLDGWWRFADHYRPHHALAGPPVWRQALGDVGFAAADVLGVDESDAAGPPDRGVVLAQGPVEVAEERGLWVLAADRGGAAAELAAALAARNQMVVLAGAKEGSDGRSPEDGAGVVERAVEPLRRESWEALLRGLPNEVPLSGVVHSAGLDGHGPEATTDEMAEDAKQAAAGALALLQGVVDSDAVPGKGLWLLTRGAQVLERESRGELAGALLWGMGKVVAREAPHLQPRMIDLDPEAAAPPEALAEELLYPDAETHVAYRRGSRRAARLVRAGAGMERLALPDEPGWVVSPDPGGVLEGLDVEPVPARALEPREVRVAVEAAGLNFWDVFRSLGFIQEGLLGGEMCGHVLETGSEVTAVEPGDRVVGLGFGTFTPEVVTREEMVALAPEGMPLTALATLPTAFVSAALSYELAELKAGDRVLIHAGAGGVGLAAIQLAQAAGAEGFTTASAPKQAYLRSLGVTHVFDSRSTAFGKEVLDATGGAGVGVVVNSLTGEGFIDASLSCLARGGRFVELARRDILSEEEMAAVRPDVAYFILELDVLKSDDPARAGTALNKVMEQLAAGEVRPLIHSRWPLAETGEAMRFMRAARHVGKIVLAAPPLANGGLRQDRTYLVTGGLGGIGCVLAEWLADRGAGAIVLNGRRDPDPAVAETIAALRARGAAVRVELADVTDGAAVDAMLERIEQDLPPLGGVIHSVGVLSDAALGNQNWERFEAVLWPKVLGAWHLHRATADRDLDMFVLFSSVAGVLGNPGQANHAAANAFLDQLAAHRRARGLPGQTIAWGAWAGLGEAEEQRERIARQLEASGTGWMSPQQGLRAFDRMVRQDPASAMVAAVDWASYGEAVQETPAFLEELLSTDSDGAGDVAALADDLPSMLRATPAAGREALLVSFLQQEVQAVLRLPSAPAPTVAFFDLGIDSLMAVELRNRLNRAFAGEYVAPNTVVFDYPDIAALAHHLAGELGEAGAGATEVVSAPEPPPRERLDDDGIAIVGMACRFPGAPDLAAFWRQLEAGTDAVTDGRPDPGSWDGVVGDPASPDEWSRVGGFIEDIDKFDAAFFRITPIEARMMDPRQRLLLETSWHALEDAGIDPETLRGSRTGVYAGVSNGDYRDLALAMGRSHGYLGTTTSVATGRVAFVLGLNGPAVPVDVACASSLAAVHQAVSALRQGEVDLALVGGVNAMLSPTVTMFMREAGMLSASGRCRTFDAGADGFVRGEGCGMVVLKRLREAQADGDRIWGVVRGSAVNQNGAAAGLTVPNGPAQERVIEDALSRAGIAPAEGDYLEAHGAGSDLGDPIEVNAAASAYGRGREEARPLLMGSVKTNIGHLECAAGVASLIKTVLAMHHGVIPRHLHFHEPNPHLDWDDLPVRVVSEATEWPLRPDHPPRAGVSAFALSGTNAHVVVEGYPAPDDAAAPGGGPEAPTGAGLVVALPEPLGDLSSAAGELEPRSVRVLPLSGKSPGALRELARRYLSWLDDRAGEFSSDDGATARVLADMAWTAGVGRSHFDHRAGLVFHDVESLRRELKGVADADAQRRPVAKAAFVYAGNGSQWVGMGRTLYDVEPVVRAVLDRCDATLGQERGGSLLEVMFGRSGAAGDLDDPVWAQPALYALECALTALWASVGIRPAVALGQDVGELAAAQAAGVFGLEEGLRLAAARGVFLTEHGASEAAPAALEAALADIAVAPPSRVLVSGVTGRALEAADLSDGSYWSRQARAPAALGEAVPTLTALEVNVVVEIGPDVELGPAVVREWSLAASAAHGPALVALSSLRRPSADARAEAAAGGFAEAVADAYAAGIELAFAGLFTGETRHRIALPVYPFERRRHWIEALNRPEE